MAAHTPPPLPPPHNHAGETILEKRSEAIMSIISKMGKMGIDHTIDRPRIVACGDQSSGKSSIMEALTGISFPSKDTLCTRFAIEVTMQREDVAKEMIVSIEPARTRPPEEQSHLRSFCTSHKSILKLPEIVAEATEVMNLRPGSFTYDLLRIEIAGPSFANLTVIDLPGIFHVPGPGQTKADRELVKSLVIDFMRRERTIILLIVSAKNQIENQVALEYAKEADPGGTRTFGVISKPDMLEDSPGLAQEFVQLAQNQHPSLQVSAWHVVRTRKSTETELSDLDFNQHEVQCLASKLWDPLPAEHRGIKNLKIRLEQRLADHMILFTAPLAQEFKALIADCEAQVAKLSTPSVSSASKVLFGACDTYRNLVSQAIKGDFTDDFFYSQSGDVNQKQLCSLLQASIKDFQDEMRRWGHVYDIVDGNTVSDQTGIFDQRAPVVTSRAEMIEKIILRIKKSKQSRGQFNTTLLSELFIDQSQKWSVLVHGLVAKVVAVTGHCVLTIIEHIIGSLSDPIWKTLIKPALELERGLLEELVNDKLRVFNDHRQFIFDQTITDQIEPARQDEVRRLIEDCLTIKHRSGTPAYVSRSAAKEFTVDRCSAAELLWCMNAYYKSQLDKLLLSFDYSSFYSWFLVKLPGILTYDIVSALTQDQLRLLSSGSVASNTEKTRLSSRLDNLRDILADLYRLASTAQVSTEANKYPRLDQSRRRRREDVSPTNQDSPFKRAKADEL